MSPAPEPPCPYAPEAFGLGWPTLDEARELFAEVGFASMQVRKALAGTSLLSPYGRLAYSGSPAGLPRASFSPDPKNPGPGPGGAVVHFTAAPSVASTVRYFCDQSLVSNRSSHVVVAQGPEPGLFTGDWTKACPRVAALPALPVQCRLPNTTAVAGAWTNAWAYHLELVNWGPGCAVSSARQLGFPQVGAQRWEPFTAAQLATTAYLIRCVMTAFGRFGPAQVFGHEHVQTVATPGSLNDNKLDPGPLFPWREFRAAVTPPDYAGGSASVVDLAGTVLELLGYGASRGPAEGVRVAQYSLGLVPDGVVGPKTQAALAARVADRLGVDKPVTFATLPQLLPALVNRAAFAGASVKPAVRPAVPLV